MRRAKSRTLKEKIPQIIILGDSGAGKSAIIQRYKNKSRDCMQESVSTLQVDFENFKIKRGMQIKRF